MKLKNIVRNFLNPAYAPEMTRKVKMRLLNQTVDARSKAASLAWYRREMQDAAAWGRSVDEALWRESEEFARRLHVQARQKLDGLDVKLSGGGHYPLLYFLTRLRRPEVVVETGVAAGFSSKAFLEAIQRNGRGRLFSSDFPLFRLENPEKFVGILVNEELKTDWELHLEGDRKSLPEILKRITRVDLFHFDSDKTYSGRAFATEMVEEVSSGDGVMVVDDIQDNLFFHDHVQKRGHDYKIFEFGGKFVGIVGL